MSLLSKKNKTMQSPKSVLREAINVALTAGIILLIPLLVKQFTDEMAWTPIDFAVAFTLLFGAGFTYRLIARKMGSFTSKAASGVAAGTALFLIWSNLAVGLIGSEDNTFNMIYLAVLAVGLIGTFIANFKPYGMTLTLLSMALAQGLIATIALILGLQHSSGSSVAEILGVNGFFVFLWVVSALLYRHAAQEQLTVNNATEQ